ncbi:Ribose transport system permease protein RbsC [Pseudobythopirellula maris]|uniref:Ribose transport system permease protein RbsC n=1 Tax=Pseudobythopirellula maris TaxID=2527991 RepID=A0A5C5ZUY6_9BACT|nr:ABC transporter permease [Pseudobythopirellula maris]TWT91050.1 Ribose transport system permease protein RbsC [Pseudobythopirellula maris]
MNLRSRIASLQSIVALVVLVVALGLMTDSFLTPENGLNVLRQISVNLCLSIGMTLVILSGGIDLSVGSMLALAGAVSAGLLKHGVDLPGMGVHLEFTVLGAIVAGLVVGSLLGAFNGLTITRFGLPPFVATLGMLSIARGLTMLWTGGHPITGLGDTFGQLGSGHLLGLPTPTWIVAALVALFTLITLRTRFGRHLYAIGGNERAAELSGVNVAWVKMGAYTLCGAMAGAAGVLITARLDSATPNAGVAYELDSIAAVVIGGASLSGGRGSVLGAALGCLIIGILNNGLVLLEVSPFWQQVIKGGVILLAVAIDRAARGGK